MPRSIRYRAAATLLLSLALGATPVLATPKSASSPSEQAADLLRQAHELTKLEKPAEARAVLERILKLDPDHAIARRRLGFVRVKGAWKHATATKTASKRSRAPRGTSLLLTYAAGNKTVRQRVIQQLRRLDGTARRDVLRLALQHDRPAVRRMAVTEAGHGRHTDLGAALIRTALTDGVASVRKAALSAATSLPKLDVLPHLLRAAHGPNVQAGRRAVEAIGGLGDTRAVRYLVYLYEERGGGAPRTFFADTAQLTFVQDFDVEVASTAFIADPAIANIQEGKVVDAQVVATGGKSLRVERAVVHSALRNLTGAQDVPNKAGAWAAWYRSQRASNRNG